MGRILCGGGVFCNDGFIGESSGGENVAEGGEGVVVKGCFKASNFHNRTGMILAMRRTFGMKHCLK